MTVYIRDVKLYNIYQINVEDRIPLFVDKEDFSKQNTYDNNIILYIILHCYNHWQNAVQALRETWWPLEAYMIVAALEIILL